MEKIKSIEVDKWSEPDENHRVKHLGMITRGEAFEQLKAHLESKGCCRMSIFCQAWMES